jgi:hypothetical protein
MFNAYRLEQQETAARLKAEAAQREQHLNFMRLRKRDKLSNLAAERMDEWTRRNFDARLASNLYEGAVKLRHPALHSFREDAVLPKAVIKRQTTLASGGIMSLRDVSYINPQSNSRSTSRQDSEARFISQQLSPGDKHSHSNLYVFEPFDNKLQISEGERRDHLVEDQKHSESSAFPLNSSSSSPNFNQFSRVFTTKAAVWKSVENYTSEPYTNGSRVIGSLLRQREKSKEIAKPFDASSSREVWEKYQGPSRSLRSHKSLGALSRNDSSRDQAVTSRVYNKSITQVISSSFIAKSLKG